MLGKSLATSGVLTLATMAAASVLLMTAPPAKAQNETVLHSFTGSDGGVPESRLTSDGEGNLYGTTYSGGQWGFGTVFKLTPSDSGWNETVIHSFCPDLGCADGANPYSGVIFDSVGNLYGTTSWGGGQYGDSDGIVFELSPVGTRWEKTVLYTFAKDEGTPIFNLIFDSAGNLYGTTWGNGLGPGNVYELSPSPSGWTERVIYPNMSSVGLVIDTVGNIFGAGVSGEYSTAFKLSPDGSGGWNSTVLYTFTDYGYQLASLGLFDSDGSIYGTSFNGGAYRVGMIYKLTLGSNGAWIKKVLYSFRGKKDGGNPDGAIMFDRAGNIYGVTADGGKSGAGTVFELVAPTGKGKYKEKVLWSFDGTDGSGPNGGVIMGTASNLYGTTAAGGSSGWGTVFEVTPETLGVSTIDELSPFTH